MEKIRSFTESYLCSWNCWEEVFMAQLTDGSVKSWKSFTFSSLWLKKSGFKTSFTYFDIWDTLCSKVEHGRIPQWQTNNWHNFYASNLLIWFFITVSLMLFKDNMITWLFFAKVVTSYRKNSLGRLNHFAKNCHRVCS